MNYEARSIPIRYVLDVWMVQRYTFLLNLASTKQNTEGSLLIKKQIIERQNLFHQTQTMLILRHAKSRDKGQKQ